MHELMGFVRPYRTLLAIAVVTAVAAAAFDGFVLSLLIPFLRLLFGAESAVPAAPTAVERVIDFAAGGLLASEDTTALLRNVALLVLGGVLVKNVVQYAAHYLARRVQENVIHDLRTRVFSRLQQADLSTVMGVRRGQLVASATADIEHVGGAVGSNLITAIRQVGSVLVYLAILAALSVRLTLFTMMIAPLVVLALTPVLRRVRTRTEAALDGRGTLSALLLETIEGARLVRAYGAEERETDRFRVASSAVKAKVLAAERQALLASPLSETLGAAAIVVLLLVGAPWAMGGGLRPEVFVTFVVLSLKILSPVKKLAQYPTYHAQARAAIDRVSSVIDLPEPEPDRQPKGIPFAGIREAVRFERVWFAYEDGEWVLEDVSCRIASGSVVALVGPSGAGKSTFADLLPRFVEPTRGTISIDGISLNRFDRTSLRRSIGVVSQEAVVFNDTVRGNIAFGDAEASREDIEAAAKAAHAHEFIRQLPEGYDTPLGERGHRLSGGERQRLAIARGVLHDPPVLILDEATAHLDAVSERLIQDALTRVFADRTVLVIAHRLSTVRLADHILVMDRGRIVQQGAHSDLVATDGLYRELHRLQFAGV